MGWLLYDEHLLAQMRPHAQSSLPEHNHQQGASSVSHSADSQPSSAASCPLTPNLDRALAAWHERKLARALSSTTAGDERRKKESILDTFRYICDSSSSSSSSSDSTIRITSGEKNAKRHVMGAARLDKCEVRNILSSNWHNRTEWSMPTNTNRPQAHIYHVEKYHTPYTADDACATRAVQNDVDNNSEGQSQGTHTTSCTTTTTTTTTAFTYGSSSSSVTYDADRTARRHSSVCTCHTDTINRSTLSHSDCSCDASSAASSSPDDAMPDSVSSVCSCGTNNSSCSLSCSDTVNSLNENTTHALQYGRAAVHRMHNYEHKHRQRHTLRAHRHGHTGAPPRQPHPALSGIPELLQLSVQAPHPPPAPTTRQRTGALTQPERDGERASVRDDSDERVSRTGACSRLATPDVADRSGRVRRSEGESQSSSSSYSHASSDRVARDEECHSTPTSQRSTHRQRAGLTVHDVAHSLIQPLMHTMQMQWHDMRAELRTQQQEHVRLMQDALTHAHGAEEEAAVAARARLLRDTARSEAESYVQAIRATAGGPSACDSACAALAGPRLFSRGSSPISCAPADQSAAAARDDERATRSISTQTNLVAHGQTPLPLPTTALADLLRLAKDRVAVRGGTADITREEHQNQKEEEPQTQHNTQQQQHHNDEEEARVLMHDEAERRACLCLVAEETHTHLTALCRETVHIMSTMAQSYEAALLEMDTQHRLAQATERAQHALAQRHHQHDLFAAQRLQLYMSEQQARQGIIMAEMHAGHDALRVAHFREVAVIEQCRTAAAAQWQLQEANRQAQRLQSDLTAAQAHAERLHERLIHALQLPTITLAPAREPYASGRCHTDLTWEEGAAKMGGVGVVMSCRQEEELPVHRLFARAHQEAIQAVRAQRQCA